MEEGWSWKDGCLFLCNPIKSSAVHLQAHAHVHKVYAKAWAGPSVHSHYIYTHSVYKVKCNERKSIHISRRKRLEIKYCGLALLLSCLPLSNVELCSRLLGSGDQIKMSWGRRRTVWLECKVATTLRANVLTVTSCHSCQSLGTPPPLSFFLFCTHCLFPFMLSEWMSEN